MVYFQFIIRSVEKSECGCVAGPMIQQSLRTWQSAQRSRNCFSTSPGMSDTSVCVWGGGWEAGGEERRGAWGGRRMCE